MKKLKITSGGHLRRNGIHQYGGVPVAIEKNDELWRMCGSCILIKGNLNINTLKKI